MLYICSFIKAIVDILFDDAGFSHCLTAKKYNFDFGLASHGAADRMIHLSSKYTLNYKLKILNLQ